MLQSALIYILCKLLNILYTFCLLIFVGTIWWGISVTFFIYFIVQALYTQTVGGGDG